MNEKLMIKALLGIISIIQRISGAFVPRSKQVILFGCHNSRLFGGNTKYLFNHIHQTPLLHDKFHYFVTTKDKALYRFLQNEYGKEHVLYNYSGRAFYYFLRARWIVITHGNYDLFPFDLNRSKADLINLWHGTPIKKIGTSNEKTQKLLKHLKLSLVSSDWEKGIMHEYLKIKKESLKVTGIPRNTVLVENESQLDPDTFQILYLPTFRDSHEATELFPFADFSITKLDQYLSSKNIHINIKLHINEYENATKNQQFDSEYIHFIQPDTNFDLQEALINSNAIITDYSGVYFDFLLLDRPIIFFPYDLKSYEKSRGFLIDYKSATPGPHILTQMSFIKYLEEITSGKNSYSKELSEAKAMFHTYDRPILDHIVELILLS